VATSFEDARKLAALKNLQEVVALQAEYPRTQIEHASQFMSEFTPKADALRRNSKAFDR